MRNLSSPSRSSESGSTRISLGAEGEAVSTESRSRPHVCPASSRYCQPKGCHFAEGDTCTLPPPEPTAPGAQRLMELLGSGLDWNSAARTLKAERAAAQGGSHE